MCTNRRRRRNKIHQVQDVHGNFVKGEAKIVNIFSSYFQGLFTSSEPSSEDLELCLPNVQAKVTNSMNEDLEKPYSNEEVFEALKQMSPLKSLGPDGFRAYFYQAYWHVIHAKVCQVVNFINFGSTDASLNSTHIFFIPKVSNLIKPSDYHPISLYNVLYKLASKVLANRLKRILPDIIFPNQSAFIPKRLISDNVVITFESLHTMTTRKKKEYWEYVS